MGDYATKNLLSVSLHLATMSWDLLYEVDAMVEVFDTCMAKVVGNYCPEEKIKVRYSGKFFPSSKLAVLSKLKSKEYKKHGNSPHFKNLKKLIKSEKKLICKKLIEKAVTEAGKNHKLLKGVKKFGASHAEQNCPPTRLPDHVDKDLSPTQECNEIAKFFSSIAGEYKPLDLNRLPLRVREALLCAPCQGHPIIEDFEVYDTLRETYFQQS